MNGEERLAEKVEMITSREEKFLKIIPNHIKSGQGWEHGMGQEFLFLGNLKTSVQHYHFNRQLNCQNLWHGYFLK